MSKYFEKDGVAFEVNSLLEEARLKKAGYKEVKPVEPEKTPADENKEAVKKVNKKGGA